jgi:hypothetical protein
VTHPEVLARVVRVREALEDGDEQLARRTLAALEADLRPSAARCPECGIDCRWPGLLEEHLRLRHLSLWEARCVA